MRDRPAAPSRPSSARRPAVPRARAEEPPRSKAAPASVEPREPRGGEGAVWQKVVSEEPPGAAVSERSGAQEPARTVGGVPGSKLVDPAVWAGRVSRTADRVTLRMQERLAERRAVERRVLLRRWGIRAAVLLLVVAVVWAVVMSPLLRFDAGAAEVSGAGAYVDPGAVQAVIDEYDGESLMLIDTGSLVDGLRAVQGVGDVSVARLWPSTLRIAIETRIPVAAVPQEGGGFTIVDDEAATVSVVEEAPSDLPVVTVPLGEDADRVLRAVLGVIDELPVDLRARVQGIEAQTEDSVSFMLRDGPRVEWGGVEDSATKAQVLQVLLGSPQASSAAVIDVSAPTLPITRDS